MAGITNTEIPLLPSKTGSTYSFTAVVTNAAQRLGALITLPRLPDGVTIPNHVMFELPSSAANSVFYTFDNVQVPTAAVGSKELLPGTCHVWTEAQEMLNAHAQTAFNFIGPVATTSMTVLFTY